jgi:hypothetical protein
MHPLHGRWAEKQGLELGVLQVCSFHTNLAAPLL